VVETGHFKAAGPHTIGLMASNTDLEQHAALCRAPADPYRLDRMQRRLAAVLLALFLLAVAVIVFWPGPPAPAGQSSLKTYLSHGASRGLPEWITFGLVETLSNVVMFVPLGLLGSLALRRHNYLVVAFGALGSALIELIQLVALPARVASFDDIRLNTIGALIGFLLSVPALRSRHRRRSRYRAGRISAADSRRRAGRALRP